jgi:hypothetical protein
MSQDGLESLAGQVLANAYKSSIELVCDAVDSYAKNEGMNRDMSDLLVLELAKFIKMKPGGRAARYLDHFLFGDGSRMEFECATLIREDAGVRERVRSEIRQRLAAHPELAAQHRSGGPFTVWIRQKDFAVSDWHLALGSFPINWEPLSSGSGGRACSPDAGADWLDAGTMARSRHQSPTERLLRVVLPSKVRLSGANEYKWHPAAPRVTQCLHQAADRLTKSKVKSQNFWMAAKPCTMDLSTGLPA